MGLSSPVGVERGHEPGPGGILYFGTCVSRSNTTAKGGGAVLSLSPADFSSWEQRSVRCEQGEIKRGEALGEHFGKPHSLIIC